MNSMNPIVEPPSSRSSTEMKENHNVDVLPALKDGASTAVFPSPIEGSGST